MIEDSLQGFYIIILHLSYNLFLYEISMYVRVLFLLFFTNVGTFIYKFIFKFYLEPYVYTTFFDAYNKQFFNFFNDYKN